LRLVRLTEEWTAKAAEFEASRANAPAELAAFDEAKPLEPLTIPEGATLATLEPMLAEAETNYAVAQQEFTSLMEEPARRAARRAAIPDKLTQLRKQLADVNLQGDAVAAAGESPWVTLGRLLVYRARLQSINAEINALTAEIASYEARTNLLSRRQDAARARLNRVERYVKALRDAVTQARRVEAAAAAEAARSAIAEILEVAPEVREQVEALADANTRLAELRTGPEGLALRIDRANTRLEWVTQESTRLQTEEAILRERIIAGGLSGNVAALLRRHRGMLPEAHDLRQNLSDRASTLAQAEVDRIDFREERQEAGDIEAEINRVLNLVSEDVSDFERGRIAEIIRAQVTSRRDLLDALLGDYDSYIKVLTELNARERELLLQTQTFAEFIDANILWSGGAPVLAPEHVFDAVQGLRWLLEPSAWLQIGEAAWRDALRHLPLYFVFILLVAAIGYLRWRAIGRIPQLGERARRSWHTTFGESVQTLIITFINSIAVPVVIAFAAWRLQMSVGPRPLTTAIGDGLLAGAVVFFMLNLTRHLLAKGGLFASHFDWVAGPIPALRRYLATLTVVVYIYLDPPEEAWRVANGRMAFVLMNLAIAVVAFFCARTARSALAKSRKPTTIGPRPYFGIVLLLCGTPFVLTVLAWTGFYYTAFELALRFYGLLAWLLVVLTGIGMVRRWLALTRRRLAIEQAKRKRALMLDATDQQTERELIESEIDLTRIDSQTQSLVRLVGAFAVFLGAYVIWIDILPALTVLEEVELYRIATDVSDVTENPDGTTSSVVYQELTPITANHVVVGAFFLAITLMAVRTLPGLIEIILLQRLGMGAGERYATVAIFRYAVFLVGILALFNYLGVGWSKVQWLVAALSVGLGFGLQEIFANFISGLILLFERPIRVGDIVTIGDVSGTVTQIRIRATTITDFDRKELVVPNKEFVTGQLINWSLSDTILRLIIPVGVAYGSDTKKVVDTLYRIADEHEEVLDDPPPLVLFQEFGANSLNFELRVFIPDSDIRLRLSHEMHMQIDREFRKAGIEIAFPQRDLHIRSGLERFAPASRVQEQSASEPAS